MRVSHSKIECYKKCPYQFKLKYQDGLKTIQDYEPDNALVLGSALHKGIETCTEDGLNLYAESFPILTDKHYNEMLKLENLINKCREILPPGGIHELEIKYDDFIGYIDYLVPVGDGLYDLYDFKYSNNIDKYMESGQLHEYKYYYEQSNRPNKIRNLYFLFVPKTGIRQKKTETVEMFRNRLLEQLNKMTPTIKQVEYNTEKVKEFLLSVNECTHATEFPKNETRLCDWCDFKTYCMEGDTTMILPSVERRKAEEVTKRVFWIYGEPFTGKTTFANQFPNPLMLNTDGNIKYVDAPFVAIRDEITVDGRITNKVKAWKVFLDVLDELEKKQNQFETIIVDLLEDIYEYCRVYVCEERGWSHESDDSFKAYDIVRNTWLNAMKRLVNLDYKNIILISHEDRTKDLTKRSGDKISAIKPNLTDKLANKIAGMVDIVARVSVDEDDNHTIQFKNQENVFGGGRLKLNATEIPLDYEEFCKVYDCKNAEPETEPVQTEQSHAETEPVRRERKKRD